MIGRIGRNLLRLLFWIAVIGLSLAAVMFLIVFGLSLVDHFSNSSDSPYDSLESTPPDILWWALAAAFGSAVAAVATYSIAPDEGEYFYCPNCDCKDCVEERRQRALNDVTTAAMAGGLAGGIAGSNIGNSS